MIEVNLYRRTHDTFTFRPRPEGPNCIVGIADPEVTCDPAADRVYIGPIGAPAHTLSPGGLYLAAKGSMWGITIVAEPRVGGPIRSRPDPDEVPAPKRRRSRRELLQMDEP